MPFVNVPDWELESGFDPTQIFIRDMPAWLTLKSGEIPSPANCPCAEDVLKNDASFDIELLPLRDPDEFVCGQIHNNISEWEKILDKGITEIFLVFEIG